MNILTPDDWESILYVMQLKTDISSWVQIYQALFEAILPPKQFPLMNDYFLQAINLDVVWAQGGQELDVSGTKTRKGELGEKITSKWREDASYRQQYMKRIQEVKSLLSQNLLDQTYYTEPGIYLEVGLPTKPYPPHRMPKFDIAGLELIIVTDVYEGSTDVNDMKYKGFGFYPVRWRPGTSRGISLENLQGDMTISNFYVEEFGDEATKFLSLAYRLTYQDYLALLKSNSLPTFNFPQGL